MPNNNNTNEQCHRGDPNTRDYEASYELDRRQFNVIAGGLRELIEIRERVDALDASWLSDTAAEKRGFTTLRIRLLLKYFNAGRARPGRWYGDLLPADMSRPLSSAPEAHVVIFRRNGDAIASALRKFADRLEAWGRAPKARQIREVVEQFIDRS